MSNSPRKRSASEDDYDDPQQLVNAISSCLVAPEEETYVATNYANDKNSATEVQAYAKIAGLNWTYYVKTLIISIGRNTNIENSEINQNQQNQLQNDNEKLIDIDLGPAKVVSRQHAFITYNLSSRLWELKVIGRNGARVDGARIPVGEDEPRTPLHSGAIIDIGGTQMMFILPDSPPNISKKILLQFQSRLPKFKSSKLVKTNNIIPNNYIQSSMPSNITSSNNNIGGLIQSNQLKGFQMFNKNQLSNDLSNNINHEQDLSKDESKDIKPPYSYATMITQAILSNPNGILSLSEIYDWISSNYSFYRFSKSGWQNSIRHNLSLNKAFEKIPRRPNEPGKGMKWQISSSYKSDFLKKFQNGSLSKARRGSSVSRQLQLHLATHQQLPEPVVKNFNSNNGNVIGNFNNNFINGNGNVGVNVNVNGGNFNNDFNIQPMIPIPNGLNDNQFNFPKISNLNSTQFINQLPLSNLQNLNHLQNQNQNQNSNQNLNHMNNLPTSSSIQSGQSIPSQSQNQSQNTIQTSQSMKNENFNTNQQDFVINQDINKPKIPKIEQQQQQQHEQEDIKQKQIDKTNPTDLGIGFSSPKRYPVIAIEAYTPERGKSKKEPSSASSSSSSQNINPTHDSNHASNSNGVNNNGGNIGNGGNTNGNLQSSPALWNFVQFSTPNQQSPNNHGGNNMKQHKNNLDESPIIYKQKLKPGNNLNKIDKIDEDDSEDKSESQEGSLSQLEDQSNDDDEDQSNEDEEGEDEEDEEEEEDASKGDGFIGDLKNIDLAKGFKN